MENKLKPNKSKSNLTQWADNPPSSSRRLRLISEAAADFFDKSVSELRKKVRSNELVWYRGVCMWLARDEGYTLQAIGDWWGRDHGTVLNAVILVDSLRAQKPAYDKQFRRFAVFTKNYMRKKDVT
jgi:chromosomal replication initiation ATPase DnaA